MLAYYSAGITVRVVVPRRIHDNHYFLICLQDRVEDNNTPCEVAFNCMRQFCGISMLVKKRCFVCHKPGASMCACQCACFCSAACVSNGRAEHQKLCALVRGSAVTVEGESLTLEL